MDNRRVEFLARAAWESEGRGVRWDDAAVEDRDLYRRVAHTMLVTAERERDREATR